MTDDATDPDEYRPGGYRFQVETDTEFQMRLERILRRINRERALTVRSPLIDELLGPEPKGYDTPRWFQYDGHPD